MTSPEGVRPDAGESPPWPRARPMPPLARSTGPRSRPSLANVARWGPARWTARRPFRHRQGTGNPAFRSDTPPSEGTLCRPSTVRMTGRTDRRAARPWRRLRSTGAGPRAAGEAEPDPGRGLALANG